MQKQAGTSTTNEVHVRVLIHGNIDFLSFPSVRSVVITILIPVIAAMLAQHS